MVGSLRDFRSFEEEAVFSVRAGWPGTDEVNWRTPVSTMQRPSSFFSLKEIHHGLFLSFQRKHGERVLFSPLRSENSRPLVLSCWVSHLLCAEITSIPTPSQGIMWRLFKFSIGYWVLSGDTCSISCINQLFGRTWSFELLEWTCREMYRNACGVYVSRHHDFFVLKLFILTVRTDGTVTMDCPTDT